MEGRLLVLPHEAAIAEDIGTEYGGELTFQYPPIAPRLSCRVLMDVKDCLKRQAVLRGRVGGPRAFAHEGRIRKEIAQRRSRLAPLFHLTYINLVNCRSCAAVHHVMHVHRNVRSG